MRICIHSGVLMHVGQMYCTWKNCQLFWSSELKMASCVNQIITVLFQPQLKLSQLNLHLENYFERNKCSKLSLKQWKELMHRKLYIFQVVLWKIFERNKCSKLLSLKQWKKLMHRKLYIFQVVFWNLFVSPFKFILAKELKTIWIAFVKKIVYQYKCC